MLLPYKEPSQTLMSLFNQIVQEGRAFVSAGDLQVSDMGGNAPVGTTLAILERTLKVMSAIQARLHFSMKQEFSLLKVIIADYTDEDYDYEPEEGSRAAKKSDYDDVEVLPVSDPNASTMAQKIVQYQAVLQLAQQAPQLYNMPLLHRQMIEVMGIKNANKLVPMDEDQKPLDPVTENQNILMLKPSKAFIAQDHQAHITVHMSAMQDPKIAQLLQGNPMAQQIQSAMMAHINEHLGFEYRVQIEQQLGATLPAQKDEDGEDIHMDPQVEAQLAPLLAQAATKLLQNNQAQMAQSQAQQQQQDPLVQMQQQELQLKQKAQQAQEQKDQAEIQIKQQQLVLEKLRIETQAQTTMKTADLNAMSQAAKIHSDHHAKQKDHQFDAVKTLADHEHEKHLEMQNHAVNMAQTVMDHGHTANMQAEQLNAQKEAQKNQPKAPAKKETK